MAKMEQDKATKFSCTLQAVNKWLEGVKTIINFEETSSDAPTMSTDQSDDGFLGQSIRQLEFILSSQSNFSTDSQLGRSELSEGKKRFFDV